jgi:hypothetical protein
MAAKRKTGATISRTVMIRSTDCFLKNGFNNWTKAPCNVY